MSMQSLDLEQLSGTIVIVAPHMDDEALACGGLIAGLPDKERIHIIYATDGMRSPPPVVPGRDRISQDLGQVRMRESVEAMTLLGVPEKNLHFLCLPEAELKKNVSSLKEALLEKIESLNPRILLVPFRYDRHPDHLAVNHVVVSALQQGVISTQLIEYFVYYRWRLLPKGDIRHYIQPQFLFKVDISDVAGQKKAALDRFVSQATLYYPWQTRPILSEKLLAEECESPEYFLISNTPYAGPNVFINLVPWIRLAHRLEPSLKRWKDRTVAFLSRIFKNRVP